MPDYALFNVTLSTITPLHIGSGDTLLHEYDFAIHGGRTWRLNDTALLKAQEVEDPQVAEMLARTPPAQLLKPGDFRDGSRFFRYVLAGTPSATGTAAPVQAQIKDVFDRPYLPGSSLKGALRTALAWYGWGEEGLRPRMSELNRSRLWAGQNYERRIFTQKDTRRGREPNHDLLRALQVSDSRPQDANQLVLLNVVVLNVDGSMGAPIELEAIRGDTDFSLDFKIDLALFSEWAKRRGLKMPGEAWLKGLANTVQQHTDQRIQDEIAWYQRVDRARHLVNFFQQLQNANLGPNQFLLQIGWGTGWDDKTLGSRLKADRRFMDDLVQQYQLVRGRRSSAENFPSSRRVSLTVSENRRGERRESISYPLGWVLVSLEAVEAGGYRTELTLKEHDRRRPEPTEKQSGPSGGDQRPEGSRRGRETRPREEPGRRKGEGAPQSGPTETKPAPQKERQPMVERFSELPKPGDRFSGSLLFIDDDGSLMVEVPGLNPDTEALARIAPENNPEGRRYPEGTAIRCEVLSVEPDPDVPGSSIVHCRRE